MNKLNTKFKAVDFMRPVRDEMTKEYHEDKKLFISRLKSQADKFIKSHKAKPVKSSYSKTSKKKSLA